MCKFFCTHKTTCFGEVFYVGFQQGGGEYAAFAKSLLFLKDFFCGAEPLDFAFVDEEDFVGIGESEIKIVGDEDDGVEAGHLDDAIHEGAIVPEILTGGGFIHNEDAGTHGEDGGDADPFLLPE